LPSTDRAALFLAGNLQRRRLGSLLDLFAYAFGIADLNLSGDAAFIFYSFIFRTEGFAMRRPFPQTAHKNGSILILALISCGLLIFLAVTVFGYDRMQIWLSRNQHEETIALYNAQSAWEWAMTSVKQNCQADGWNGNEKITTEFNLNGGSCQAILNFSASKQELIIDTIGEYNKTYYRYHGVLLLSATEVKRPVAWVTHPFTGTGSFQLSDLALQEGVNLTPGAESVTLRLAADFAPLLNLKQTKSELDPAERLFLPILASVGASDPSGVLPGENLIVTYPVPSSDGLPSKKLFYAADEQEYDFAEAADTLLAAQNLVIDLTFEADEITLPSVYCLKTLTILARPEQTIHCSGFFYASELVLQQANLALEPSADSVAELLYWFSQNGAAADEVLFWQNFVYCTEYRHIFSALAGE